MTSSNNGLRLLPRLGAPTTQEKQAAKSEGKRGSSLLVLTLALLLFFGFVFYLESIPGRTFDGSTMSTPEIIQEGRIEKVWLSQEDDEPYLNVQFTTGEVRHRRCTLSSCGAYIAEHPEATIGRIPNPNWDAWGYMAMDIGLPPEEYWQLRRAVWPILGERFVQTIVILVDD